MNRTRCFLYFLLISRLCLRPNSSAPPDPYKPVLDRLQSITVIPLPTWQAHAADLPHGEDPALGMSDWQPVKLKEDWKGSRWLRLTFEVPAQLNGYSLQGARISLDLHVSSDDAIQISVFSNGNMVARTDEDGQVPITLIENAQPGQKLVLAVRVLDSGGGGCCGGDSTRIEHAELAIQPPAGPSRSRADAAANSLGGAGHRRVSRRQDRAPAATGLGREGDQCCRARPGRPAGVRCLPARRPVQARPAAART